MTFPSTVWRTGRSSQLQQTEKAALVGPPSVENTGVEPVTFPSTVRRPGRSSQLHMNEEDRPLGAAFRGEYRSRTGDLLHAMQAL